MGTLTIRVPDDQHERLRQMARQRNVSVNKLVQELATVGLATFDAENRFRIRAAAGSVEVGLRLLDKLDASSEHAA